jgi:nicotinamide riboside kinase
MIRVGFAGLPATGKTSLARSFAGYCIKDSRFKSIELISEYAREYIAKYGPIDSIWDEYIILQHQIDLEERYSSVDLLVTDSPLNLICSYAQQLKKEDSKKDVMVMEKILKKMNELGTRYDHIFYLPPKIIPVRDGIRPDLHFSDDWRKKMDENIRSVFGVFPPRQFHVIEETDHMQRLLQCAKMLSKV